ncbi:MAG: hypothetical protein A4E63_01878 [Syntrophorhabdus sp. PtaU1.Bin050]|nr:MAG: hypothetical protein A4E63_01878 [Syntrophorhabdus sp. PtaU1.Bin050]
MCLELFGQEVNKGPRFNAQSIGRHERIFNPRRRGKVLQLLNKGLSHVINEKRNAGSSACNIYFCDRPFRIFSSIDIEGSLNLSGKTIKGKCEDVNRFLIEALFDNKPICFVVRKLKFTHKGIDEALRCGEDLSDEFQLLVVENIDTGLSAADIDDRHRAFFCVAYHREIQESRIGNGYDPPEAHILKYGKEDVDIFLVGPHEEHFFFFHTPFGYLAEGNVFVDHVFEGNGDNFGGRPFNRLSGFFLRYNRDGKSFFDNILRSDGYGDLHIRPFSIFYLGEDKVEVFPAALVRVLPLRDNSALAPHPYVLYTDCSYVNTEDVHANLSGTCVLCADSPLAVQNLRSTPHGGILP